MPQCTELVFLDKADGDVELVSNLSMTKAFDARQHQNAPAFLRKICQGRLDKLQLIACDRGSLRSGIEILKQDSIAVKNLSAPTFHADVIDTEIVRHPLQIRPPVLSAGYGGTYARQLEKQIVRQICCGVHVAGAPPQDAYQFTANVREETFQFAKAKKLTTSFYGVDPGHKPTVRHELPSTLHRVVEPREMSHPPPSM